MDIRPAALEITPTEGDEKPVDPWKLPPIEDFVEVESTPVQPQVHMFLDPQIQQYRPDSTFLGP